MLSMSFVINRANDWKANTGGISRRLITKSNIVENLPNKGSHQHFCDVGGHRYECTEECECICGLPMNGNNHGDCPVELRPCPKHDQNQPMSQEPLLESVEEIKFPTDWRHEALPHCECGCSDIDADEVVGWCLHCNHVYAKYTPELQDWHFAYYCPDEPKELKETARARLSKR